MSSQFHVPQSKAEADPRRWVALTVLLIANFMNLMDVTIVNVALPSLRENLNADASQIEWVIAAYVLSFALGTSLFGMVYLMPVFLSFVRGHGPLRIGEIMLVTGAAQLLMAPLAVQLEKNVDARLLTVLGFTVFALGLALSMWQSGDTDYNEMFWPQVIRGASVMLCLLAPTHIAPAGLATNEIGDGSSLFNMMRNLGGAIGISLIDTVMFTRGPQYAEILTDKLKAGDPATLDLFGLTPQDIEGGLDSMRLLDLMPDLEKQSLVMSINDAWMLLAAIALVGLVALLFIRKEDTPPPGTAPLH